MIADNCWIILVTICVQYSPVSDSNQCVHARPVPLRRAAVEVLILGVTRLMQVSEQEPGDA